MFGKSLPPNVLPICPTTYADEFPAKAFVRKIPVFMDSVAGKWAIFLALRHEGTER